ncbi:MAG TPA: hypothetical protein VME23_01160 [Terracidiphilus sp.]|nr:hypothetical protein [Terracidiphilus sp.]
MPTEIEALCDTIEDCYEFTLSYAARGLTTDEDSDAGRQLREKLAAALKAIRGLEAAFRAVATQMQTGQGDKLEAFAGVLNRDAQSSCAVVDLVLAQPAISSQLIDNLNASIHLRALLTDLFLITEIVAGQQARAAS